MSHFQGQAGLYSCVISDLIKTPRAGDRQEHAGQHVFFFPAVQACVFSEAQCAMLNEKRRVDA